jgi:hypothetical protein
VKYFRLYLCLLCNQALVLTAQQYNQTGTWNLFNMRYHLGEKTSFFAEGQIRSLRLYEHFHYHEVKGGISRQLHPHMQISMAAGNYETFAEGGNFVRPRNLSDFRLWPQLLMQHPYGRWTVEHRYRAEFRFTSLGYRTRYRYRVGIAYQSPKHPDWRLNMNNELFFGNRAPYFERNRASFSVQRRLNSAFEAQLGYIYQYDYRINDETGRDFLLLGLYWQFGKGSP